MTIVNRIVTKVTSRKKSLEVPRLPGPLLPQFEIHGDGGGHFHGLAVQDGGRVDAADERNSYGQRRFNPSPACGLSGPLRKQSDLDRYDALRRRAFRFVGFTSYLTFPALAEGLLSDYGELCDGWCHCFRKPQDYISPGLPTALISESDFVDYRLISPRQICGRDDPAKEFDFIYVCLPGSWTEITKNWALAKAKSSTCTITDTDGCELSFVFPAEG